jgi:uncharacterized SAM-binding protein YcdF (DUF218 family)
MTYIQPLLLAFLTVAFIGLIRLRHCKGSFIPGLGVLGLLMISWPPFDWLFSRPLEVWYPAKPFQLAPASAQAIVVLSSAVDSQRYWRPYSLPDRETYERCEFAAWLHKSWQHLPVLACGGPGNKDERPVSVTMRELLHRAGVPEAVVWIEERSRSTHENAVYGAEVLREHGIDKIILVVEAKSMLRAAASFRKQGIVVAPASSDFRELGSLDDELIPSWKAIRRNETTLHETVGLAWYWLHGWI